VTSVDCLSESVICALVAGELDEAARDAHLLHTEVCTECRSALAVCLHADSEQVCAERYDLLEPMGAGAHGIVYAAFDRVLERRVAIKVLRRSSTADVMKRRLEIEARALAQVQHPNVLAVYDVALSGHTLYIAMQLVIGETLRAWCARVRPNDAQLMALFRAAASALYAVHERGLLHRDIKPENMLVDEAGHLWLSDFGLVGHGDATSRVGDEVPMRFTLTGERVGTPRYMAPEQLRGEVLDKRADVFALCASFYEMAHGKAPFRGSTPSEQLESIDQGIGARALLWRRGLSADKQRRFASMRELITAIDARSSEKTLKRRARWAAALFLLVAGGLARTYVSRCDAAENEVLALWSDEKRAAIRKSFGDKARVQIAGDRIAETIGHYVHALGLSRRLICERRPWLENPSHEDVQQQACFERRQSEVAATLAMMASTDALSPERVNVMLAQWPRPDACVDLSRDAVSRAMPADDERRAKIMSVFSALDAALNERQFKGKAPDLTDLEARWRELDFPPLSAYGEWLQGTTLLYAKPAEAIVWLDRAEKSADRAQDDVRRFHALHARTQAMLTHGEIKEAHAESERVRAVLERLGSPMDLLSDYERLVAYVVGAEDDLDGAFEHALKARDAYASFQHATPHGRAVVEADLCSVSASAGERETAEKSCADAFARISALYGTDHFGLAKVEDAYVDLRLQEGDGPGALVAATHAHELTRSTFGEVGHLLSLLSVAEAYFQQGSVNRAERILRELEPAIEKKYGRSSALMLSVLFCKGNVAIANRDPELALAIAREIAPLIADMESAENAAMHASLLGRALRLRGAPQAHTHLERARAIFAKHPSRNAQELARLD
jgi:eukaryotic-like serine/threonine-protein kinase